MDRAQIARVRRRQSFHITLRGIPAKDYMNFHASFLTVPPVFVLSQPDQRRPAQTGQLSRRELRRIIAEQLD